MKRPAEVDGPNELTETYLPGGRKKRGEGVADGREREGACETTIAKRMGRKESREHKVYTR